MKERIKLVFSWKFLALILLAVTAGRFLGGEAGRQAAEVDLASMNESFDVKDWTPQQKEKAIDECMSLGSDRRYCACSINELDKKYTLREIKKFFEQTEKDGHVPLELVDIQDQCSSVPTPTNPYVEALRLSNEDELNETVLATYKADIETIKEQSEVLLQPVLNNTSVACQSIINAEGTRQHIYYMYLDSYYNLEAKYGKYRDESEYIDNNLNTWVGITRMVKDECSSVGQYLP